ncbi:hypothetical protein BaRGS_00034206 [Batillaria attramentaria]|uniref:G-protein coupled receptors family 1 profile domain-containing protein n=1 Tax=Batillaria attramentaria TaxID=370345 RepID=A0ABD0JI99_9CAEN
MLTLTYNATTSLDKFPDDGGILSTRDKDWITLVLECGFRTSLAIMGVFTNVTTLVVLAVQGLKDSVNISLFALTLSDLAYVVTLLPGQQHCFYVAEDSCVNQEFIPHGVMFGAAFSKVSAGITALISVERCLCVMLPLNVRRLVTYRCTLFAVTSICLALFALFVPIFMMLEIQHVDIGGNRTAAYAVPTAFFRENFTLLTVLLNTVLNVVIPISLLAIVAVCTVVTVIRLKMSARWRQAVSSSSSNALKSEPATGCGGLHVQTQEPVHVTREQKPTSSDDKTMRLTRMMVAIACVYIVCIIPGTISTLVRLFIPQFDFNARYHNMFAVIYVLDFTMLTFNSSVNFFVYLAMSSRCTLFAITSICLALLALFVPVLMMLEIQHVDIGGNRTAAYAVPTAFFRENFTLLSVFSDTVISVVIPVSLLAIVAVCTAVTVIRLKTSSKWRQAVSSASSDTAKSRTPSRSGSHVQTQEPVHVTRQQKPTSVDDKTVRLTRMMVAIACIYIVCIIPGTISTLVRLFIPEFSLNDRYHNMFAVVYALDFTMLTFNSSVNFFVYLAMSSRFRQIFLSLVTRCCRSSGQMARLPGNRTQPSLDSVNTEVSHAL